MSADADSQGIVIHDAAFYDLAALKRMGWGTAALRTARRKGLKVRRSGRKSWVLGAELREHILTTATVVK